MPCTRNNSDNHAMNPAILTFPRRCGALGGQCYLKSVQQEPAPASPAGCEIRSHLLPHRLIHRAALQGCNRSGKKIAGLRCSMSCLLPPAGMLVLPLTVLQPPLTPAEVGHECDHCYDNYVNQGFLLTQCSEGDLPVVLLVRSILP